MSDTRDRIAVLEHGEQELGAVHILRQHFLVSLDTFGGVVSTWSAFALTLGTYRLMT